MVQYGGGGLIRTFVHGQVHYFMQSRDQVRDAQFPFPTLPGIFGGKAKRKDADSLRESVESLLHNPQDLESGEWEGGRESAFRELLEEIGGVDFSQETPVFEKLYLFPQDLGQIEQLVDRAFNGHNDLIRGYQLDDKIPIIGQGKDEGRDPNRTYRDMFKDRGIFIGVYDLPFESVDSLDIREGKGILIPHNVAHTLIMTPLDRMMFLDILSRQRLGMIPTKLSYME